MPQYFSALAVKQNTVVHSGTGDFPMAPAIIDGFRRFGDALSANDEFMYYAKGENGNEWEIALGRFTVTGDGIVVRNVPVYAGSNGTNKVFFTSGVIEVSLVNPFFAENFVSTAKLTAPLVSTDLPKVSSDSTVAIGPRADASIGSRATAIGEDSKSTTDAVVIGSGAQSTGLESVLVGHECNGNSAGALSPHYTVGVGIKATPFARGMFSNSAGGSVSTDITRLYIQTTSATPDLMEIDLTGGPSANQITPHEDGRDKSVTFEVHLLGRNVTDNDAWYEKFNLVGIWDGVNFVQVGSTIAQEVAKGAGMTAASATCTIVGDQLQISVTGIAAKTIQWAATVISNTLWHSGVPGSGV